MFLKFKYCCDEYNSLIVANDRNDKYKCIISCFHIECFDFILAYLICCFISFSVSVNMHIYCGSDSSLWCCHKSYKCGNIYTYIIFNTCKQRHDHDMRVALETKRLPWNVSSSDYTKKWLLIATIYFCTTMYQKIHMERMPAHGCKHIW